MLRDRKKILILLGHLTQDLPLAPAAQLLTIQPGTGFLTSLGLSLFISRIGVVMEFLSEDHHDGQTSLVSVGQLVPIGLNQPSQREH